MVVGPDVVPVHETNKGFEVVLPGAGMNAVVVVAWVEMVPSPETTFGAACASKVVLREPAVIAGTLLTVTVYVPGSSVDGPPEPAGAHSAAANVPGNRVISWPLPLLSAYTPVVSQNGPPAPLGPATCTVTE